MREVMFGTGAQKAEVMEIKMVLYLPRDAASVPVSRQVLDGCLETLGVTADTRTDIALALTESCANVIQHARSDDEYEVQVRARNGQCAIEVVNAGSGNGEPAPYRGEDDEAWAGPMAVTSDPVPATAEHGRGQPDRRAKSKCGASPKRAVQWACSICAKFAHHRQGAGGRWKGN